MTLECNQCGAQDWASDERTYKLGEGIKEGKITCNVCGWLLEWNN